MPVSGHSVFRELQAALEDVRTRGATLRSDWQAVDGRMNELVAERGDALVELARHGLPDLSHESIQGTLTGIQGDLRSLLDRKERRVVELAGQLERLYTELQQSEQELEAVTEQLNEKVEQRDMLQNTVAAALKENVEFQSLSQQAIEAEQELQRNEDRVDEISEDALKKLPDYENSRLFLYLYRRKYGTQDYEHRGLTRRLDRWVANLVDFYKARKSYEFLKRTPELMQEEVHRRRDDFNALMAQVEELEQFAADEAGLTQVLAEGEKLGTARDALVAKVDGQKERCRQVEEELLKLRQSQGQFYEQALSRFRSFLTDTETVVLEQHARQTPEPTDDEIVGRIAWLTREMDELEPHVTSLSQEYNALEDRSGGMDFVVRRYQQLNFDSQRSYFSDDFHIQEYLDRFRKGVTSKDDLWASIRRRQEFEPTWVEKSAGGAEAALKSPLAQILMHAMVEAVGSTMSQSARRSIQRRSQMGRGGTGRRIDIPMPQFERTNRPTPSVPAPAPSPTRDRGFTSGRGF